MKRIIAILLALVLVFSFAACANTAGNENDQKTSAIKVALITDYGDITDQSFNQTTYEAAKAWCTANSVEFTYYKPTDNSTAARIEMLDKAVADGYNVIVLPGCAFAGLIVEAAANYPDVKFVALDVAEGDLLEAGVAAAGETYDYNPANWELSKYVDLSNVYCAVYQEELCGYMAGYAAVKLGYEKLGFLGGMAVPAVVRYGYGFIQGADAAAVELDKEIAINIAYGNQFYGDADITAKMDTWYAADTECVFACGGGIYTSATEAAAKVGGKVIGVDVDQSGIINTYGENLTVTSAMKGLALTVTNTLDAIIAGKWTDFAGKIETLGLISEDPEVNYVQLPVASTQFEDGKFTADDYKALVADMFNGVVTVSNAVDALPETTNATVDDQGNIK